MQFIQNGCDQKLDWCANSLYMHRRKIWADNEYENDDKKNTVVTFAVGLGILVKANR